VAEASEIRLVFRKHAVSVAVSISGVVWITSAVAFTLVEDVGIGRRVESFGDALWWSAATISTVGYGDIYPVTVIGRFVAVLTMIVGVSTFGVVTARMASALIRDNN
jgi:voltage-gated potassium channel